MKSILILVIVFFSINSQSQTIANPVVPLYGNILGIQRVYNEVSNSDYTQLFFRYFDDLKIKSFDSVAIISHYFINKKGKTVSVIIGKKGTITKIYEGTKLVITDTVPNRFSKLYAMIVATEKPKYVDSLFWVMFLRMEAKTPEEKQVSYYEEWKKEIDKLNLFDEFETSLKETEEIANHILSLLKITLTPQSNSTLFKTIFKRDLEYQLYFYPHNPSGNLIAKYDNSYPKEHSPKITVPAKRGEDIIPGFLQTSYAYFNSNIIFPVFDQLFDFYFHRLFPEYKSVADSFLSMNNITYLPNSQIPEYVKFIDKDDENYKNGKIYETRATPRKAANENFVYYTYNYDKGYSITHFKPSSQAAFSIQEGDSSRFGSEISKSILRLQKANNDIVSYIRADDKTDKTQLWLQMARTSIPRKAGDAALLNMHMYSRRIFTVDFKPYLGVENPYLPLIKNKNFPEKFSEHLLYDLASPPFKREGTIFNYMIAASEYANIGNTEAAIQQYIAAYMKVKNSFASPLHKAIIKNKITEELIKLYQKKGASDYVELLKLNSNLCMLQAVHPQNINHAYDEIIHEAEMDKIQQRMCSDIKSNRQKRTEATLNAVSSIGMAALNTVASASAGTDSYNANKSITEAYINRASSYMSEASNYTYAIKEGMAKFNKIDKFDSKFDVNDFDIVWRNTAQMTTENLIESNFLFQNTSSDSVEVEKLKDKYLKKINEYVETNLPDFKNKLLYNDQKNFEEFAKEFAANEIYQFNIALRGIKK